MNPQTPDATHFLQFWLIIALIISVVSGLASIVTAFSGRKQRREVSFPFNPASKEEFDQFTATTNTNFVQIRDEMKRDRESNQIHASERQKTLFIEIKATRNELLERTDAIRVELSDKIDENRRELNDKLDRQLPETIATIINAKRV